MKLFRKKQDDDFLLPSDTENGLERFAKKTDLRPDVLTPEEVNSIGNGTEPKAVNTGALEALKKRLTGTEEKESNEDKVFNIIMDTPYGKETEVKNTFPKPETKSKFTGNKPKTSLMDKCLPYFKDEQGKDISYNEEPLYELQSVADILKSESEESIKRISEKYGIPFKKEETKEPAKPFKINEELFKEGQKEPENNTPEPIKTISDIDGSTSSFPKVQTTPPENYETVTFTPVSSTATGTRIAVTTKTQQIDLTGELVKLPDAPGTESDIGVKLEENEFDEFVPETEPSSRKEIGKLIRKFSILKRNYFISAFFSGFITLLIAVIKLPFLSGWLLEHTVAAMSVCTALAGVAMLLNVDMFKDLLNIFRKTSGPDCAATLASLTTVVYAVFAIISGEVFTDMLITLGLILFSRSLCRFKQASYMLSNFKIISASSSKNAVKLISDPAVTLAMAKDSVEGDTLIAASQKAESVSGYMKYSTFGSFFGGRMPFINGLSLLLSLITGIASAIYFEAAVYGLYAAAAIQCFSALPIIFFIDTLPLHSAAKKLNKMGAMISGKTGAEQVERANAAVLSSTDLFPAGTVTLHQMKVLSENSLDDTLIRAASLTEYMKSPLAPIFKTIANSGNITTLPDTDTVKYEDRLGISGWVDNRLLFIGNRTLMTTHGIEVPPLEVDRKILRQGYFPVYVATRDKACALLTVQYSVDPIASKELRRLTGMGVTLLVNNTDPNLTEAMICDYLGLYEDSVKVMSAAGCYMHKNATVNIKTASAPAAYRTKNICLAAVLNCAARIKRSNLILTASFVICAVLGAIIFAYTSFMGSDSLISDTVILIYGLISTLLTYLIYLIEKP